MISGYTCLMASTETLTRADARHDAARAGANVEIIGERIFLKKLCAPADDLVAWMEHDIMFRGALDHLAFGTSPDLEDTGDPETLALLIAEHHDYPNPDWLGQSIADR